MWLSRALRAETLKLKRTLAWKMLVLAPLAILLLTGFMASQAPFSTLQPTVSTDQWARMTRVNFQFWALLMMPLYITLETALIAGVDHSGNQWKALCAKPMPRWAVYIAKVIVVIAMTAASTFLLVCGLLASASILQRMIPVLHFGTPPLGHMFELAGQIAALTLLSLTIRHWVSLRWKSFSVAFGVGVFSMVTSFAMLLTAGQYGGWPEYFPGALPMLVLSRRAEGTGTVLLISSALALVVTAAGCWDFCRSEVN